MRILVDLDGSREVVDLVAHEPQSTLGQLVESVCGIQIASGEQLFVDSTAVSTDEELRGLKLLEGARLSRTALEPAQQIPGWSVSVIAGGKSGRIVAIPDHRRLIVGRAPQADLTLATESASWNHCTIEVEGSGVRIVDSGSTNGTYVSGARIDAEGVLASAATTVVIGGTALAIRPTLIEPVAPAAGSVQNLTPAATAPFNRPPKLGQAAQAEPLIPPAPKDIPEASKFNLIAIIAPIVMAGVLVVVLGDMRFALFALMSPIMAIGMYFEQRRRRAKNVKEEEVRFTRALGELRREIVRDAQTESLRLQEAMPDLSIVLRRPAIPSTKLWARRSEEPGCLALQLGVGDSPWQPTLDMRGVIRLDDRVKAILGQGRITAGPVVGDLSDAGVIGIAGEREAALALARSLIMQLAVQVGPADLTLGVFCDSGRELEWDWASWLPHTRQGAADGSRWMSYDKKQSVAMLRSMLENIAGLPTPSMLVVLDSEVLTEGRDSPARDILGHGRTSAATSTRPGERAKRVSGIVIAATADKLPSACTTVVEVGQDSTCIIQHQESTKRILDVILSGASLVDATECARALARFEDPELVLPGASLPKVTKLHEILGTEEMSSELILRLWDAQSDFVVPIGYGENGQFKVDLVNDGPHGVVAGTTGSGKSEILKAMLASLVAHLTPEQLNLILVDFKGGAAFAAFERLPHTIGTISNLDEQLADRAIRALQAEMRRRQRLFAAAGEGIENLPAYLATNPKEPLPRILFIVDEFKELVKGFPDVLASLMSVAAIGRTLGVHMILATQQPAGVVSEAILANSNLRIAARVQKPEDSSSVISDGSAATISRFHRGRAYIQRGQDDLELVQTAYVSAPVRASKAQQIDVRPVGPFGTASIHLAHEADEKGPTDLEMLVESVVAASLAAGYSPPRRVWPEALGESVTLSGYRAKPMRPALATFAAPAVGGVVDEIVLVALADDPDEQRQHPVGWNMREGNLLLMGVPGSGTSTTLTSLALALARAYRPDELDLLCLDMGFRALAALEGLPHTTAYVGSGPKSVEQQTRFLRFLRSELQRRRSSTNSFRKMVIFIDGLAALRDELQDYEGQQLLDALYRVYADGPSVGMYFVVATTRAKSVPSAMDEVTTQRWVYRLADDYDYAALGIKGTQKPAAISGRCVSTNAKLQMHIATPDFGLESAVSEAAALWEGVPAKTDAIGAFPDRVPASEIAGNADFSREPVRMPVGLREDSLEVAILELYEGEHVLITGPARSGKSTLLRAMAETLQTVPIERRPLVYGIYDRRSLLGEVAFDGVAERTEDIPEMLVALRREERPVFLLIDDAERVDDSDQSISSLLNNAPATLTVVAAGRSADLRSMFNHWTKMVRKARVGVLLQPDVDYDGELLGVKLPRKAPAEISSGRGYACVGGNVSFIQAMSPSSKRGSG